MKNQQDLTVINFEDEQFNILDKVPFQKKIIKNNLKKIHEPVNYNYYDTTDNVNSLLGIAIT